MRLALSDELDDHPYTLGSTTKSAVALSKLGEIVEPVRRWVGVVTPGIMPSQCFGPWSSALRTIQSGG